MNFMSGKGLKDGQGHGLSFSRKRGVTRPRSAKMETERELTIKERARARALDV